MIWLTSFKIQSLHRFWKYKHATSVHISLCIIDGSSGEDDSESEDWSSSDEGSDGDEFDDTVCPSGCDPNLFEHALRKREERLDIEDELLGK